MLVRRELACQAESSLVINEVNKTGGLALSSAGFIYMKGEDPVHYVGLLVSMLTDVASSAKTVGTAEFLRAATDRPIAYVPH